MDYDELLRFIPRFLEHRYPGRWFAADADEPKQGWVLDANGAITLLRAGGGKHPFLWIRGGIAHAVPRAEALAWHVASQNKGLMLGRVYVASGDAVAMVGFDEAIFTLHVDLRDEAGVLQLIDRLELSQQYTAEWSATIRERFGGQPFAAADWYVMSF